MTQDILNFLTGGVFTSLRQLIEAIIEWIITFVSNTTYKFFEPLINLILSSIPFFENIGNSLQTVFNWVMPFISFILDASLISRPILVYLIVSLIFRITLRLNSYLVKLILQWYEKLIP